MRGNPEIRPLYDQRIWQPWILKEFYAKLLEHSGMSFKFEISGVFLTNSVNIFYLKRFLKNSRIPFDTLGITTTNSIPTHHLLNKGFHYSPFPQLNDIVAKGNSFLQYYFKGRRYQLSVNQIFWFLYAFVSSKNFTYIFVIQKNWICS